MTTPGPTRPARTKGGELRAKVARLLADRPAEKLTIGDMARQLGHSHGAVRNAALTLVRRGEADQSGTGQPQFRANAKTAAAAQRAVISPPGTHSPRAQAATTRWTAAHQCADHDATTMLARGQEWCDALDAAAPRLPVPENLTDLLSGAVAVVMDSTAATDAADLAAQDAAANALASRSKAQAQDRAQRARQRRKAAATAKSVFNARSTTVHPDGTPAPSGNPVTGTRRPTADEQSAAARLSRALRAAAYRERTEERTTSPTPPGRLNMRAALARDAQRAAGSVPTAEPFTHTRRRNSPTPPLRVGIAVDVSGSMRAACKPVASAAWIVARAAALTDPDSRTATIAYDRHLTALTRPTHRAPERVTTFDATGGHHNLANAIDALDHGLELSLPGAGRLLVIVTDAHYGSAETAQAVTRVKQLTTAGCAVLQLTLTAESRHLPGTTLLHLPQPSSAPAAIAKAATDAIRRTR
ncbi:hypothetical protein GTW65_03310 [Streptomyces sp. SID4956]|nr:hypothetical protein [Streptomyces sp. SID4956]